MLREITERQRRLAADRDFRFRNGETAQYADRQIEIDSEFPVGCCGRREDDLRISLREGFFG